MALELGELVAKLQTDNRQLITGLAAGEAEFRAAGNRMQRDADTTGKAIGEALAAGGRSGGDGFIRDALGRLHDSRGRFVAEAASLGSAGGAAGGGLSSFWQVITGLGQGVKMAGSQISGLIQPILILYAAAILAIPAVGLLGGALGALPALALGGGAAIGALLLGTKGLGDQFKQTAVSGHSAADTLYQVTAAQHRLRDANNEVVASERALAQARADALEQLQDLDRELRHAKDDAGAAALNIIGAQRDLSAAITKGDPYEVAQAQVALQRAIDAQEDAKDRVDDLGQAQAEAAAKGVEGSDQVQAALDRQLHAIEAVADAQHALAQAQQPQGGGGAAAEITKLAPSAQAAVDAVKKLKPAFEGLRLDVQEKLFKGVGDQILGLAVAWDSTLHQRLGGMATTFNGLFTNLATSTKDPKFISNVSTGVGAVETMIGRIGKSVTGPLVDAFGRLSRAAAPFIDALGDEIGDTVDAISAWIKSADESGKLDKFFDKATGFLHDVFDIGGDVATILGSILGIDMDHSAIPTAPWDAFKLTLDKVAAWFKDPENQKKIDEFAGKIEDLFIWLETKAGPKVEHFLDLVGSAYSKLYDVVNDIWDFGASVVTVADHIVDTVKDLAKRVGTAGSGMWDWVQDGFKGAMNWVIDHWNKIHFSIPGFNVFGINVAGTSFGVGQIPRLANGGMVRATPGGRLVNVAEAGEDEIVSPKSTLRQMIADALGGAGGQLTIVVETRGLQRNQKKRVRWKGGDVQLVVGTAG